MSDILASVTPTSSQFSADSQFDVTSVDSNLRAISAVESKWRLPALPDEVKLDMASMPDVSQQDITEFLLGLDRDFHEVEEQPAELITPGFMPNRSATDQ